MKRLAASLSLAFAWHAGALSLPAPAAEGAAATGNLVSLPPMMVEESTSSVPWLYVQAGDTEFLSRCSAGTTRQLVEAWLTGMQLVRVLVPDEFLGRTEVPSVFVLYSQDAQQTVSTEIQRELQARDERRRPGEFASGARVDIALSMRLTDRDMHASIAYIDEAQFGEAVLSVAPGHVRYLLEARVPKLPAWLMEGIERAYRGADVVQEPITLSPLTWGHRSESVALASDPARPRALLPAGELFAIDPVRAAEYRHPRRVETRAAQQELFFRWATVTGGATRAAFWKFAARAAEAPVTEEMFEACFGFGFAELRDRLSDYLPKTVERMPRIQPGRLPPLPEFDVERATPNQIARVRGEWERLAIGYVQRRLPEVREPYIAQARRTLRRAYDAGDRDPRLLATLGLCEIDAGDEANARRYLEPAVAGGVRRPRAYVELARLRFTDLRRDAPETKPFSFTELAPVITPLRQSLQQSPPLAEAAQLLGEAWARCEFPPTAAELTELETTARLFTPQPAVTFAIATALARHGKTAAAVAVIDASAPYPVDDDTRDSITHLREELAAKMAPPPTGRTATVPP
jgi:hypothetical protein